MKIERMEMSELEIVFVIGFAIKKQKKEGCPSFF